MDEDETYKIYDIYEGAIQAMRKEYKNVKFTKVPQHILQDNGISPISGPSDSCGVRLMGEVVSQRTGDIDYVFNEVLLTPVLAVSGGQPFIEQIIRNAVRELGMAMCRGV